jgi:hypothetical protein
MSTPARALLERWRAFARETESSEGFFRFVTLFFGIWGVYDCADLWTGGTASNYWLVEGAERTIRNLRNIQIGLAVAELSIVPVALTRRAPRGVLTALLAAAFALRTVETLFYFGLNDFLYYSATVFLLLQFFARTGDRSLARWPREFFRVQTAWIYFATGLLKLNAHWLSGDHLWIRQEYMFQVLHWPEPVWLQNWMSRPRVNQELAIAGAGGELTLGVLLAARAPRKIALPLAVFMHGFAALALNVWFFGASMVAQVAFVSAPIRRATPERTDGAN